MTLYGVNTLLQSDTAANTIPSGAGYNTPERIEFAKGWIDDAAGIGSQVIRYPGDWIGLEQGGKGQFNADYVAETVAVIEYAASKGIEVIYEFGQTPEWARPPGVDAGSFTPPADPQDYADAVAYLHQQFVNAGVANNVSSWEIWNEPNANLGWPTATYRNPLDQNQGIDPAVDQQAAQEYVTLLNGAYDALKAVDPSVTVLGGSLAGTDFEYLGWMLDAGAKFDGLAVHPYTRNFDNPDFVDTQSTAPARPTDDPTVFAEGQGLSASLNERFSFEYGLKELRKLLDEDGRGDVNLYITEIGWGVGNQGTLTVDSYETQAEYLQSALQVVESLGYVEAVTIFQLYDFIDGAVGLLDDNGNLRPGARALQEFIENADGSAGAGQLRVLTDGFGGAEAQAAPAAPVLPPDQGTTDTIFGTSGDDRPIDGTAGDDLIISGTGADFINMSTGNDTIVGDDEDADGPDIDRVNITGPGSNPANFLFTQNADGSVTVTSAQFGTDTWYGIESVFFEDEGRVYTMNTLVRQDEAAVQPVPNIGIVVTGTAGDDVLAGTIADDLLIAGQGDDVFLGDPGNDTIIGDPANGVAGFDRLAYNGPGSQRSDFLFTQNADGSITAESEAFGTDLLYGIDSIFFDESGEFVEVDALF